LTLSGQSDTCIEIDWQRLYRFALRRLGDRNEARWMVEECSGLGWAELIAGGELVPTDAAARLRHMVDRRRDGEPLQYVLGHWSFRRLELMVDPRVLIPRPETEQVVDVALAELERTGRRHPVVVDLGTGSGAIALSIAVECEGARVWATDVSSQALEVAKANLVGAAAGAAPRVRIVQGDWWAALPDDLRQRVDMVISNPPYVSSEEMDQLDPQITNWEPRAALIAGPDGLDAVEAILSEARSWLTEGGVAVIEIAPCQARRASARATAAGFSDVTVAADLSNRDRVLVAKSVGHSRQDLLDLGDSGNPSV
jgi:release factor glutamine methyltransferase